VKLKPDLPTLLYAVLFCVAQHYGLPIARALNLY